MENNNPTSGGSETNTQQSRDARSDTQSKMWASSSDGLINSPNGRESGVENIELLTQNPIRTQSPCLETLFFRDGQRKIDFVLVYESSEDQDDAKTAIRKIYQENLIKQHGLELEEETSLQVLKFYFKISRN